MLTALLYAPVLRADFIYEDQNDLETFFSTDRAPGNRWITAWTYRASHAISDVQPWGYHLGNVLIHVGNGAVLWAVLPATWPAVCGLALFLVHPLQVESVAYISNRADLVMTTWLLLALLAAQSRRWGLVLLCGMGSVLSKESGVMTLPLVGWWLWTQQRLPRQAWYGVALCAVMGAWAWHRWPPSFDPNWTTQEVTKAAWYVSRVVWPFGLSIEQDWTWITPQMGVMTLALWSLVLMRHRALRYPLGCVALALLPRLVVPLYEGIHAHHFYGPMVGLSLGVGVLTQKVPS